MDTRDRAFYLRWIAANGWAESAGLGTTFVVGVGVAPYFDRQVGGAAVLAGALLAVVLGTVLEGVLVGVAQERVLRTRLRDLRPWLWTLATAAGAGLAWMLGMVPSTVMALTGERDPAAMPAEPGLVAQLGLAVMLGVAAGPILGAAQWIVLRRHSTCTTIHTTRATPTSSEANHATDSATGFRRSRRVDRSPGSPAG
jgi:hypothetical protein